MKRWEYLIIQTRKLDEEGGINELGKQGWELVAVTAETPSNWEQLFFKRELPEPLTMAPIGPPASMWP